jgi:hypothetical protein
MPGKPNKKIIAAVFAATLVVLASGWLVIFFLGNKMKASFEKYQKEKLNSFVLEEKRNKILKLERDLPDLEKEKNSLEEMLAKKDASLPFLRILEKVAGDSACLIKIEPAEISKIKFEKKVSGAPKKENDDEADAAKKQDQGQIPAEKNKKEDDLAPLKDYPAFSVEVSGHFSSVVDFFEKLENMPYFVRPLIVDISLEEEKGAPAGTPVFLENEIPDGKNVKMKIVFVVYGN